MKHIFWEMVIKEKDKKTTQEDIAIAGGINPKTIKQKIHYGRLPDVVQGQKIAAFLGTTVEYLVTGVKTAENTANTREQNILKEFRLLKDYQKDTVEDLIMDLTGHRPVSKKTTTGKTA
jgi:transcriptional regulator with XRE-family HTH domain